MRGILVPSRTDAPDIVDYEHDDPDQVTEKERAALRAETGASLAKQAAASKKQAALREAAAAEEQHKIAEEALEHQAEIEAETRVEEGTVAELKSQAETVINKDELIDVASCTRSHGYKGVVTRLTAQGCRGRHTVVSGRMRVLECGIQPAFSGKCPVQVDLVSITENMLDAARGECNRLELRSWRLKEGEQTVGGHSSGARRRSVVTC